MKHFLSLYKKIYMKKTIIILVIIVLVLFGYFQFKKFQYTLPEIVKTTATHTFFADTSNNIKIKLSKDYNLSLQNSDYILDLRSPQNLRIHISNEQTLNNFSFSDVIKNDMEAYLKKFNQVTNIVDIHSTSKNNLESYSYSFTYLDEKAKTNYTIETIWINTNLGYYIIDIQYPTLEQNKYINLKNEILSSFTIK